tara:strand:+ start:767 stop:1069 length:303 start_codon:yes stop_codon:yes gene_type:complete
MNTKYTEEELLNIVEKYEKIKMRQTNYMTKRYKNDPEFAKKVKARSRLWYENNKTEKKQYYQDNKEYTHKVRRYRYALKTDTIERYKLKYPEEYKLMLSS